MKFSQNYSRTLSPSRFFAAIVIQFGTNSLHISVCRICSQCYGQKDNDDNNNCKKQDKIRLI